MRTAEGRFTIETETTCVWEDAPRGGTRMTLRNEGTPAVFAGIAGPAMAAAVRRANR